MVESFYDVLGVTADATQAEITAAYRERVLETHPDRNDDPDAAEQFKRVTTAEEVLSDEAERARYDRLGHDSYVRTTNGSRADDGGSASTVSAGAADPGADREWSWSTDDDEGPSHHARHRQRRGRTSVNFGRRGTDRRRGRGDDADGATGNTGTSATGSFRDAGGTAATGSFHGGRTTGTGATSGFRYSVHDWDDDVDVGAEFSPITHQTLVVAGCLTLLYPLFVYLTVSSLFPAFVRLVVSACALGLVGYLLTMPRIATVSFGIGSVLVPVALPTLTPLDPFSPLGLVVVVAFWVPLGYALALWWVLR